jgi:hypothetical protein
MTARRFPLVLLIAFWACGANEPSDPCPSLNVTVTRAPDPVFDWSTTCAVGALDVTPSDSTGRFLWTVLANPGENSILSPVTYGIAPEGTAVMVPADPLIPGREYRVHLRRATGPGGLGLELVGEAAFTLP